MGRDLLERMRANPTADWTIADVETLCRRHGLQFRNTNGSSHVQIKHPKGRMILTVPSRRPIKAIYIRKLVRYVESEGAEL